MKEKKGIKKFESHIKEKDIFLLVLSKADYSEQIIDIAKVVSKQNAGVCYVSANKPAKALMKLFGAEHIDMRKFWFIDCISRAAFGESNGKAEKGDSVILYTSSPRNLTEISINISGAISNGIKNVFIDALSTFTIYEDGVVVIRFAHNVIAKVREYEGKGFFVVLKNEIGGALLDDLSMFVDEVIEV